MLYIVLVLCCDCVLLWWCLWCLVVVGGLLSDCVGGNTLQWLLTNSWKFEIFVRQVSVAQNFVRLPFCRTKNLITQSEICATGSRRTKFCAAESLSHKKIWLHNLKFCATGSRRTKFCATDAEEIQAMKVNPPIEAPSSGRRPELRIPFVGEDVDRRTIRCGRCNEVGHNRKKCKNPIASTRS